MRDILGARAAPTLALSLTLTLTLTVKLTLTLTLTPALALSPLQPQPQPELQPEPQSESSPGARAGPHQALLRNYLLHTTYYLLQVLGLAYMKLAHLSFLRHLFGRRHALHTLYMYALRGLVIYAYVSLAPTPAFAQTLAQTLTPRPHLAGGCVRAGCCTLTLSVR